ncbi:RecB family exonuclease [Thermodesulfobacteriota bacterium]
MARKKYQSPTSINTYRRCPHKYYLRYIKKLKGKPSIYLVRGIAVHEALAKFYDQNISDVHDIERLKVTLQTLFHDAWSKQAYIINQLELSQAELAEFYNDSILMLMQWLNRYLNKASHTIVNPKTELKLFSKQHKLMGIIDAVYEHKGNIALIDYKTSKKDTVTDDIKIQMGIYALLYQENFGKKPAMVGVDFLKTGTKKFIRVNDSMIDSAKKICREIQIKTSSENIADYPCTCGGWCKKDFVYKNENTSD